MIWKINTATNIKTPKLNHLTANFSSLQKQLQYLISVPTKFIFLYLKVEARLRLHIQSALVISKSKGPSETLWDIRISTY